jgi:hypothetical protein
MTSDDKVIASYDGFHGKRVVATEKLDGENTTLYHDHSHARSLDSKHHPSRDWVKAFHGSIKHLIPPGWRICGENLFAKHSIEYTSLKSYFYGFSVWDENNVALPWDDTVDVFEMLGITPVPVLYRGVFDLQEIHNLARSLDLERQEGFVVRVEEEIPYDKFGELVAKWVRKGHVQTDEHWMRAEIVPNKLEIA